MVKDLENLRMELGLAKIAILGHSFGGPYAIAYAVSHPDRVEALIFSCSAGADLSYRAYGLHNLLSHIGSRSREKFAFWTSPEQQAKDPARAGRESFKLLIPAYIYKQEFVPVLEKDLTNPAYSFPTISDLVRKSLEKTDFKSHLKVFTGPALIIDGRQDFMGEAVPIGIHLAIQQSILVFLDEYGHYPWLDAPKIYLSEIKKFLGNL